MADFNNQCLFAILTHRLVDENPSVVLVDDLPIEHMRDPHHLLHEIRWGRTCHVYSGSLQRLTTTRQFQARFFLSTPTPAQYCNVCCVRELASHQGGSWRESRGASARLSHCYVDPWSWGWQRFWTPVSNPQRKTPQWNGRFCVWFWSL